jgi:excisionase family DNA binding protein
MNDVAGYQTVDEYAQKSGVHRETVKRWLRCGKLEGVKLTGSAWLIPHPDQLATSCCGCEAKPIGPALIFLDSKGNSWHQKCAGDLLAKFIEMRKSHLDAALT